MTEGSADRLRVTHCVGFYFPESVGGTEVFVHDLALGLGGRDVDSHIVAATDRLHESYEWEGVPVLRYPSFWADVREYSATAQRAGLSKFQELVLGTRPDVFHLHSWTTGAGLRHLSQVAELGIPCVLTMHVASALCMRGTVLLNGEEACDGRIDEKRCAKCWAESRGLPSTLAAVVSHLPQMTLSGGWETKIPRRIGTVLSIRSLIDAQARDLRRMAALCDRIVAPSQWVEAALVANAVPPEKLMVSRQAVAQSFVERGQRERRTRNERELCVGYVGRLEPNKGPHVLLEAMAHIPRDVPVRLIVAGSGTELPYVRLLEALADNEPRIDFLGSVSHDKLPEFFNQIDVLAVPSHCMETGPLVVLEAFAFGTPVMGANLGGIAERVRDGKDGWLVPFDDSEAWAKAMREAALDRTRVAQLAGNILPSRTMTDVAGEMAAMYRQVLAARIT